MTEALARGGDGIVALVVAPGKEAKALYLPWDEPKKNLNRLACQVALAADGSATVDGQ